jgi:5-formyltetrahydrofolate cyclo-ligase
MPHPKVPDPCGAGPCSAAGLLRGKVVSIVVPVELEPNLIQNPCLVWLLERYDWCLLPFPRGLRRGRWEQLGGNRDSNQTFVSFQFNDISLDL